MLFSDGVGCSGTFCALMISINQFKAEQNVDIYKIIKSMRSQRPGLVANAVSCMINIHEVSFRCLLMQDQYKFIHKGLVAMLKHYSPYYNFTDDTSL